MTLALAPALPPPPEESWSEGRLLLPGGIPDGRGGRHHVVRVRELTGRDEELLADRRATSGADQVTELLARVVTEIEGLAAPVTRDQMADLTIGDRDYVVLRLRQLTLGDRINQVVQCGQPGCGRRVDVEFAISEIPVRRLDAIQPSYPIALSRAAIPDDPSSTRCVVRLPTGRDHAAIEEFRAANPGRATTVLLTRVILELGRLRAVDRDTALELPLVVRREIAGFLDRTTPGPDLRIAIACPHCGEDLSYGFDLYGLFFSEWSVSQDTLFQQVHLLASRYHWSESEILGLSRRRRARYVNLALGVPEGVP